MCRLFGYRSITMESIASSLITDANSLLVQSKENCHGWGIAYYQNEIPHLFKSQIAAYLDEDFIRLGSSLMAHTVLAHLRRATHGKISLLNCHPFQYGPWIMAHNGGLPKFADVGDRFRASVAPQLLRCMYGTTDSEIYFAMFLDELVKLSVDIKQPQLSDVVTALRRSVNNILSFYERQAITEKFGLNVIISNGPLFLAYRLGNELGYYAEPLDKNPQKFARLVISSEPTNQSTPFIECKENQIIAINHEFHLFTDL